MRKQFGILALQHGGWGSPASESLSANLDALFDWTQRELSQRDPVDLVVLPELSTTPYFCGSRASRYFSWAESIPGRTTDRFAELAVKFQTTIVVPLFERSQDGSYYNSAAVLGPDGRLIGRNGNTRDTRPYRKCHVPTILNPPDTEAWEDFYFRPGSELPVFQLPKATLGILICYDRWFPEAWRMLVDRGAEVVAIPMVAWGFVEGPYLPMLQSRAAENEVFVVSCNRAGVEQLDGISMANFGRSVIVGPDGVILSGARPEEGQTTVFASVDLEQIAEQRRILPLLDHRRRDLYGEPAGWVPNRKRASNRPRLL